MPDAPAAYLSTAWDQNGALTVMSPAAARCKDVALRWITGLLGLPDGTGGGFVTGATMAEATCLAAARDAVLSQHGWDAGSRGLIGAPPGTVLVGAEVHTTVRKALGIIGLRRDRVTVLPVDDQGRIVARDLPELSGPAIACFQAGNVDTGASDPLGPLVEWARQSGAWEYVDGAFVIAAVQADGTCWCGPTSWHGSRAMRVSVSGWSTTEDDIDRSVAAIVRCASVDGLVAAPGR